MLQQHVVLLGLLLLCGPVDMDAIVARASAAGESPAPALAARVSAFDAEVAQLRAARTAA